MNWIVWSVALVSTTALVALWFWEVRRKLRELYSMVESARSQLTAHQKRATTAAGNADMAEILHRSESIYRQAVAHYNDTLCKPWCRLPGHLLGFDRDTGEDDL